MINTHTHSGWNNDDSSHYDGTDRALDLDRDLLTITHEIEGWHSNGGSYGPTRETTTRAIVPLSWHEQNEVHMELEPFRSLARKYPYLETFRFLSNKHYFFMIGRLNKAVKAAKASDYHAIDNTAHVFVLPNYGKVIRICLDVRYGHKSFSVKVEPIYHDSLFDYELFED